jgi:2-methylisocitrate lyase-like PEP mutase family enzyme
MREALRKIDAPMMFNYVEKKVPALTAQRFETLGFRIVCFPISSTLAYAMMMTQFAAALKKSGTTLGLQDDMLDIHDYEQLLDRARYV